MPEIDLAELFELLHGAPESFRTLRGSIRTWRDRVLQERAFDRHVAEMEQRQRGGRSYGVLMLRSEGPAPPPTVEETVRLWLERPGRMREVVEGEHPRILVSNGRKLWSRVAAWGAVEHDLNDDGEIGGQHTALFSPLALAPGLEFELVGEATVAGRGGVAVRALPREADGPHVFGLAAAGADEYELVVDRERGVVLRTEARLDGAPFEIVEFMEVAFDQALGPDLFVFTPEPGETVRTLEELTANLEDGLTLEEATVRASFPLFVPATVWPTARMNVSYTRPREQPRAPEQVSIHYWDDEGHRQFALDERAGEPQQKPPKEFEPVDLDGVEAWVWRPAKRRRHTPTLVRLVREGTQIELSSQDLDRDQLLELARALVPARTQPPGFA